MEGEKILLTAHPGEAQELLEGERLAVDLFDDAPLAESRLPGLAAFHHHANHRMTVALDDDNVVETIGNGAGGHAVVRLENEQATEGVDDDGPVFEKFGADVGAAVDGGATDVVEGETTPQELLESQERDLSGTLGAEVADGTAAEGDAFDLADDVGVLPFHLCELRGTDGVGQGTAGVEEYLVADIRKGAYFYIRYVLAQAILQSLARGVGIVVAAVGEGELVLAGVDAGGDAFVEQCEAEDAVFTLAHHSAAHTLHLVAADGEGPQLEGGQLYGLHLTDMACSILRLDGAQVSEPLQGYVVVDDALAGSRVELEAVGTAADLEGDEQLVALHLDGYGHQKVALGHEEIGVVALDLSETVGSHQDEHHQQYPSSHHSAKVHLFRRKNSCWYVIMS